MWNQMIRFKIEKEKKWSKYDKIEDWNFELGIEK